MTDAPPTSTTPSQNPILSTTMSGGFEVFSAAYAVIVAAGGILGYVRASSVPSLAAGLTFGALIGTGSYLEGTYNNYWLTYGTSGVLAVMMGKRFLNSKKFMPAGLVTALSLGMFARYSYFTIQSLRKNNSTQP